ncbi:hypothetical protein B0A52_05775 [Exophiala mesophila]|uniref:C2H2-type domain-containing protein n=1 Tax=Exophiala mesophila TaxID=212818 RepID=A0A438N2H7_EXOME|nr:hypothetical protein B0A52_05775 [Exophiala mesophila]
MPPPPTPLAHRRSHRLVTQNLSSSSVSAESSACLLHKMSKAATFHSPSSQPSESDPSLSIPYLARRSPSCSSSTLTSWLSEKGDVARSIAEFEQTFSGARGSKSSTRRRSAQNFDHIVRRVSLPSDEGFGSSISPDKGLSATLDKALDLASNRDSGIGSSISDSAEKVEGSTCEEDGLVVQDLIQGWIARCMVMCDDVNLSPTEADSPESTSRRPRLVSRSAVTQSIAPASRPVARHPQLSSFAKKKVKDYIITPILEESRFQTLHPLVTALGTRTNKSIRSLRDLEQSLIFQPLVSTLISRYPTRSDIPGKTLAISTQLYRSFGEFTIQLVIDTYQQLSESEQRRASDRPYDNGYFLDLVQQVNRLASHIGSSSSASESATVEESDDMAYSPDDEVTLEGGLDETGNFAELVRWKDGKGISLRTGQPYEPLAGLKRQSSTALDEDIARSMARRKKGYIPEFIEMKCSDKTCDKTFTRKCDLSKHEKTHSRPYKCSEPNCKYHEQGLPTEKELERHWNDKHSADPLFYKCEYCEFKTKRESNCKQHMEKKHGWTYERAKGKDKAMGSVKMTPGQTPRTPAMDYSPSPAMSLRTGSIWDDNSSVAGSITGSTAITPFDQPMNTFDSNFGQGAVTYSNPIFPRATQPMQYAQTLDDFDFNTFPQSYSNSAQAYISPTNSTPSSHMMGTPITPTYSNITEPSPYSTHMDMAVDCPEPNTWNIGLQTPNSFLQPHSRNPSMSNYSPMVADTSAQSFDDDVMMPTEFDLPQGDFALFGGDTSAFSNLAGPNATLFPSEPEAFAALDNNPIFNEQWADDMFDFNMEAKFA